MSGNLEIGSVLRDKYKILGKLNEGSYGIVYLAQDINTRKKCAIKYIFPMDDSGDEQEEAQKEIDVYLKIGKHRNMAQLLDYFGCYLVLEYCEKGDLYDLIKSDSGPRSKSEILNLMKQLIDFVTFCHKRGVYHRDIKPENIFITADNKIKLGDWGLATTEKESTEYDVGSERYMAPELFHVAKSKSDVYDCAKVDIWSLGICFLNLIFHKNPFAIAGNSDKMFVNFTKNKEVLFDIFPSMSEDLFSVLKYSLDVDPKNRDLGYMKHELLRLKTLTCDETFEHDLTVADQQSKPINIERKFEKHQERKPFSIQTPRKSFKKSRRWSNTSGSSSSFDKRKQFVQPPVLEIDTASANSKDIYIPPNLRNKLKSPAFQAKTDTTEAYRFSDSMEHSFAENDTIDGIDDIILDDFDEGHAPESHVAEFAEEFKALKVSPPSTKVYVPPHHRPDYHTFKKNIYSTSDAGTATGTAPASGWRRKSKPQQLNLPAARREHTQRQNHSSFIDKKTFAGNFDDTLSSSVPFEVMRNFDWTELDDDSYLGMGITKKSIDVQ